MISGVKKKLGFDLQRLLTKPRSIYQHRNQYDGLNTGPVIWMQSGQIKKLQLLKIEVIAC